MASLDSSQRALLRQILARGRKAGATPKERKAAVETGLVESGLRNLPGGDADSAGWRQERSSLYANPTNVNASADRFFKEARAVRGKYGTAGALAAAVQRPREDLRYKYQTHSGEADSILKGLGAGGASGSSARSAGGSRTTRVTSTTPGVDNTAARNQAIAQWLLSDSTDPTYLVSQLSQIQDTPGTTTTKTTRQTVKQNTPVSHASVASGIHSVHDVLQLNGTVKFDGKPVAAWVGHVLSYARKHGWSGGLSSGYRSDAEQTRIYNSGVRPAAKPKSLGGGGSNHEGTRYPLGAADVTSASQLSSVLKRSPYASILQFAGAKDPVHFSHPHNGSY